MRSASSPRAVTMMIGIPAVGGSVRIAWQIIRPSRSGSIRSRTTRSGGRRRTAGITAAPEARNATEWPAFSR